MLARVLSGRYISCLVSPRPATLTLTRYNQGILQCSCRYISDSYNFDRHSFCHLACSLTPNQELESIPTSHGPILIVFYTIILKSLDVKVTDNHQVDL